MSDGSDTGSHRIQLPDRLNTGAAEPLYQTFVEHRGKPIEIDLENVRLVGGLCLQILLSAKLTWEHDGVPITIAGVSENATNAFELLGITPETLTNGEPA